MLLLARGREGVGALRRGVEGRWNGILRGWAMVGRGFRVWVLSVRELRQRAQD